MGEVVEQVGWWGDEGAAGDKAVPATRRKSRFTGSGVRGGKLISSPKGIPELLSSLPLFILTLETRCSKSATRKPVAIAISLGK